MRLAELIALVEAWYPPEHAEDWDAVGLVCGDPEADVRRVLLAVDPVQVVADEAVSLDADLVITHHPLFLRGTSSVAATEWVASVSPRRARSSPILNALLTWSP